ncbi:hypothetical protein B9Z19DRAFT_1120081 [Tuber borchii]|uniref:Uncharacterized protein n=1 Tax=Tuber borchii TaxID=42251 RepID=A0A2T7A528_TUBBO|nr:hypothetical protein B9Z19DRAFT_1120081 [Tuber borchii]
MGRHVWESVNMSVDLWKAEDSVMFFIYAPVTTSEGIVFIILITASTTFLTLRDDGGTMVILAVHSYGSRNIKRDAGKVAVVLVRER